MINESIFPLSLFSAIDERRWDDLQAMLASDIVYERPGYQPLRGSSEVMSFYRHERIIAKGRHVLADITASDGRISCHGHFTGLSKSNTPLEVAFCDFYILHGCKLAFRKTFFYIPAV